jgi:hypothetical protein
MTHYINNEPRPSENEPDATDRQEVSSASEAFAALFRKYHPPAVPSGLSLGCFAAKYRPGELVEKAA